jgi:hypothetical protein
MEDDLDEVKEDAGADATVPSQGEEETSTDETQTEEKDLTDEELATEVERLKEEAKKQDDPKEKRHLEQQAGWFQKVAKERDKAKTLEKENAQKEESMKRFEQSLIEEVYSKTVDDKFGLPYFENLYKTNPDIADKVAQDKWQKSAKELILETKRTLADQ